MKRLKQKVSRFLNVLLVVFVCASGIAAVAGTVSAPVVSADGGYCDTLDHGSANGTAAGQPSAACCNVAGTQPTACCQNSTGSATYDESKDPTCIPAGCPGSDYFSQSNTTQTPSSCANIPFGCPGSAKTSGTTPALCPYAPYTLTTEAGSTTAGKYYCGSGSNAVAMTIDIGCKGKSCKTASNPPGDCSAVLDATFAIIRFLSSGVGIVVVGSIILGGIQYSASRGDPKATASAIHRIQSSVIALIIFIFGYAILNYLIPAGFFQ